MATTIETSVIPKPTAPATYLGDGLYARYDGHQLEVYSSDGIEITNIVYIPPAVFNALCGYAESVGMIRFHG